MVAKAETTNETVHAARSAERTEWQKTRPESPVGSLV